MNYQDVKGDLIELAKEGKFDVIVHGCNCFCTMGAGIAPQMAAAFGADTFKMESKEFKGDINKLGTIDYEKNAYHDVIVVNAYTQFGFGRNHKNGTQIPLDYHALILCLKKMNELFQGMKIGLPRIGCGLAGGNWIVVQDLIKTYLPDLKVTIVEYQPKNNGIYRR